MVNAPPFQAISASYNSATLIAEIAVNLPLLDPQSYPSYPMQNTPRIIRSGSLLPHFVIHMQTGTQTIGWLIDGPVQQGDLFWYDATQFDIWNLDHTQKLESFTLPLTFI